MIPLIDIVFLLLVFFIYAMFSMAVHHSLPVNLPVSSSAKTDKRNLLSITIKADGRIFLNKKEVDLQALRNYLQRNKKQNKETAVMLFADKAISYQRLFEVLDQIRLSGIYKVALQAVPLTD